MELDIRDIKQTLGLDHLRCKSPDMIRRELWVTLLAIARAAMASKNDRESPLQT